MIRLRPAVLEDRRAIYSWLAESDLTSSMLGPPDFPDAPIPTWEEYLRDYEEFFFTGEKEEVGRSFILKAEGRPVGQVNYAEVGGIRNAAELDIWLASSRETGKGFGSAGLMAMAQWLWERFGTRELIIRPSRRNGRAIRAYEKAGFRRQEISLAEQEAKYGQADYNDAVLMIKTMSQE